jgi:DNA modification methylase
MELTKQFVEKTKKSGENAVISLISQFERDSSKLNFILENLGYIPKEFKGDWLFKYTEDANHKLRMSAIKSIGKLRLNGELDQLYKLFKTEPKTEIKREIISSIGRQRNIETKCFLFQVLKDDDPKIVCQAIRALLVFKNNEEITNELKKLRSHKNEMVQAVIEKEFFANSTKQSKLPHTETYNFLKNTIVHGDVREVLKSVPEDSIHLTFTSPPYYNARDYSIYPSYKDYLEFLDEVFKEVHRVTKEGRFLLINTSPIIIPRISRQHSSKRYPIPFDLHNYIVNSGWEYLDDIIWLKPETSVKNRVGGFQQHRKPLGYKPNTVTEMIMVYRKKTTKLLDWNIRQYSRDIVNKSKVRDGFETTNVWKIDPTYSRNHTAVFPVELCKRVIEYYSFEGDLVFDPFGGSGTFGRAAKSLNRLFFLTELNDDYFEYMKSTKKSKSLFNEPQTKFLELEEFNKIANDTN